MCGIAGLISNAGRQSTALELRKQLQRMSSVLTHRGPDGEGNWLREDTRVGLAHRRLAILELSEKGAQPMESHSGRFVIVFNGEIYNHLEIREELRSNSGSGVWIGTSDTETLLASLEYWGLESSLRRLVGMFAFAVFDRVRNVVCLARDRMGEKPLYYGWHRGGFFFASELSALRQHQSFDNEIDPRAVAQQIRFGYVPAPLSIYRGIKKLSPGCFLEIPIVDKLQPVCETAYWSFADYFRPSTSAPYALTAGEATDELERLLRTSVTQQMLSDVPLGAFLSGGVDSSMVVALMQAQSRASIKTFSIGFHEPEYDEAANASEVAGYIGTDHTSLYVTPEHAADLIITMPSLFDEPFSDSSQIPTLMVSQLAREHVTVSLSGDGGDELFGGYNRYLGSSKWWNTIRMCPYPIRRIFADAILNVRPGVWRHLEQVSAAMGGTSRLGKNWSDKVIKISRVLNSRDGATLYRNLISHHQNPLDLMMGGTETETEMFSPMNADSVVEHMMLMDAKSYLPDGVLTKLDRSAMSVSLETRVPLLDHRVVEFAASLPMDMKIRNGQGKWLLREVLKKYVPTSLIDRPKMGFGVPLDSWLRGPLRDWAESLLNETKIESEGYLRAAPVRKLWAEHLSGKKNLGQPLWNILAFQGWLDQQRRL